MARWPTSSSAERYKRDSKFTVEENDKGILENTNMFPYVNKEEIIQIFFHIFYPFLQYQNRIGCCLLIIETLFERLMYTVYLTGLQIHGV